MWAGVRNPLAQKHLRGIKRGDRIFYYHTGKEKAVVATAKAASDAYPDPDDTSGKLSVVDIVPDKKLPRAGDAGRDQERQGVRLVPARPHVAAVGDAGHRRGVGRGSRSSVVRIVRDVRIVRIVRLVDRSSFSVRRRCGRRCRSRLGQPDILISRQLAASEQGLVRRQRRATGDRRRRAPARATFRVAGIYEPTPDPARLGAVPREVRLHLPDLLDVTRPPGTLAGTEYIANINVALADPADATAFARDVNARMPGVIARPSSEAAGSAGPSACSSASISPSRSSRSSPPPCFCSR